MPCRGLLVKESTLHYLFEEEDPEKAYCCVEPVCLRVAAEDGLDAALCEQPTLPIVVPAHACRTFLRAERPRAAGARDHFIRG